MSIVISINRNKKKVNDRIEKKMDVNHWLPFRPAIHFQNFIINFCLELEKSWTWTYHFLHSV